MKSSSWPKLDILPKRHLEMEAKVIAECLSCGVCIDACPCVPMGMLGDLPPKEITEGVKDFLDGGTLSCMIIHRAFDCSRCGICLDICPKGIDVYDLQQALRCHIISKGERELTLHQIRVHERLWDDFDFDDILASIQIKPSERRWVDGIPQNIQEKDVVVFLGCYTRRYVSKINVFLDILELLGLDSIAIAGICCGTRAQIIGKLNEADQQGLQLISVLKQHKPKEVVVFCPTCLYTIKTELAKIADIPFRVRSIFDALADNLDKLRFTQTINKTVVFHDPCKLGRMSGEYEPVRRVLGAIPGLRLVEMPEAREKSNCCGGTAWRYNPNYARILRKKAMDCVKETGVEVLVTGCLICYNRFRDAKNEYPFQIVDVVEMVGEALGYNTPQKLDRAIRWMLACHTMKEARYGNKHAQKPQWGF